MKYQRTSKFYVVLLVYDFGIIHGDILYNVIKQDYQRIMRKYLKRPAVFIIFSLESLDIFDCYRML